ncbi:hypothetical protein BDZ91DRAFT_723677 [Kalaharituber pfeilii]|nr:hypothetical protein BDZ91DRAFT_723677 [Kalaharituber pfeilii]
MDNYHRYSSSVMRLEGPGSSIDHDLFGRKCLALFPDSFNMAYMTSRLHVLQVIINTFRLLYSLVDRLPSDRLRLFWSMERSRDVQITIYPTHVVKRIPASWEYVEHAEFTALYHAFWENRPKNVINLLRQPLFKQTHIYLYLTSIGLRANPENSMQLKHTMRDILNGLVFLHTLGYVHRDLRWQNIIKENDGNVRIIDLEHAGREGKCILYYIIGQLNLKMKFA